MGDGAIFEGRVEEVDDCDCETLLGGCLGLLVRSFDGVFEWVPCLQWKELDYRGIQRGRN